MLVRTVLELRARSRMYGLAEPAAADDLMASAREHAHLLDALVAGNCDRARKVMMRHLERLRRGGR